MKKRIMSLSIMFLMCISLIAPLSMQLNTKQLITKAQTTVETRTFLYDATQAVSNIDNTIIFDAKDRQIKFYSKGSPSISLPSKLPNITIIENNVLKMKIYNNILVVLAYNEDTATSSIHFYDIMTHKEISVIASANIKDILINASSFEIKGNNDTFVLYVATKTNNHTINQLTATITLKAEGVDAGKKSSTEIEFTSISRSSVLTGLVTTAPIIDMLFINNQYYLQIENKIYLSQTLDNASYTLAKAYDAEIQGITIVNISSILSNVISSTINKTTTFTIDGETEPFAVLEDVKYVSSTGNNVIITTNQKVLNYEFTTKSNSVVTTLASNEGYKDPTELFKTEELRYFKTISSSELYLKPYDAVAKKQVLKDKHVILLSETLVNNYSYVMLSDNETKENTKGYMDTKTLVELAKIDFKQTEIKIALDDTSLMSYPSQVADDNIEIANLSKGTGLKILSLCGNYNYSGDREYYLVETIDTHKIGFVPRLVTTGTIVKMRRNERVLTNAEVIKKSEIYTLSENDYLKFDILEEGARIRVVDNNSDSRAKYTKIVYNNAEGNSVEGYILSNQIDRDGLTPLQIVGVVLIIVNIGLLVVFYISKKRLVKD
ncbi:MAG: hypothetical protein RR334_01985 [Clostridia bacterium]